MPTAVPKKRAKPNKTTANPEPIWKFTPATAKFNIALPPELHRALALDSVETDTPITKLVLKLVERRFNGTEPRPIRLLSKPADAEGWKTITVFIPTELRDRAIEEVRAEHGRDSGNATHWKAGSLAAATAGLVAENYGYAFESAPKKPARPESIW